MNSLLELRAAAISSRRLRFFQRSALSGLAATALLSAIGAYGQGQYYPVNPPGAPYGTTYTGITVHSNADLQYLQASLPTVAGAILTLQSPIPTTTPASRAPTAAEFATTVTTAMTGILNGTAPAGVSLATLSNEAVAYLPAYRATTATAIAQSIIAHDPTNAPVVLANLLAVVDGTSVNPGLARTQPTLIDTIVPNILTQAATNSTVALGIPQIVAAAISDIPTDLARISTIVSSGGSALSSSNLSATQKTHLFLDQTYLGSPGYIYSALTSPAAVSNPVIVAAIAKAITANGLLSMVPAGMTAPLQQIVASAVSDLSTTATVIDPTTMLPVAVPSDKLLGAVADGALSSQGAGSYQGTPNSTLIKAQLNASAPNQEVAGYTDAVVTGYTQSDTLAHLNTYLGTVSATLVDAAVSGAVTRGSLTGSVVLQNALPKSTLANVSNVVAAAIYANPTTAVATISGAINTTSHTPNGPAGTTFGQITLGAAEASPLANIGTVVLTILNGSAATSATLTKANIQSIVDQGIVGATIGGNPGAYADIVYKAETVTRLTSGANAQSGNLVTQAIDSIFSQGGLPYIAAVAAAAGDVAFANRAAIQSAATAELNLPAGGSGAYTGPATKGMALVQAIQSSTTQTYTNMLSAFNTASTTSKDTILADVYAAVMADTGEVDAALASAIKQTSSDTSNANYVSPAVLTATASNAIRGITGNLDTTLQMVQTVATHIKAESLNNSLGDLFDFVSHQIALVPANIKDIVTAATVIDPDHAHYISHAAAFQSPLTVYGSVGAMFTYAQITNPTPLISPQGAGNATGTIPSAATKGHPGSIGTIIDQPAAAAAITAGLTTGILEANMSTANTTTALSTAIAAAVTASVTQNGTLLKGPTSPFFNTSGTIAGSFQQSTGASATAATGQQTVGAAGAITGFIAEMTLPTDTTISPITAAVLQAAVGGSARSYALQIAQAAGQALGWIANANFSNPTTNPTNAANIAQAAMDIANAMAPTVGTFATLTQLINAATFGINQAATNQTIGAGALGLNATHLTGGGLVIKPSGNSFADFYLHQSATGTPVTDIFNL